MIRAQPITEGMIRAVLDDCATTEEAEHIFDAALTDADLRKRLGLLTFAEEREQDRHRDANAVRILAAVLLMIAFLFAFVGRLDTNARKCQGSCANSGPVKRDVRTR